MLHRPAGEQRKQHAAEARTHAGQAVNAGDRVLRENVRGQRQHAGKRPGITRHRDRYPGNRHGRRRSKNSGDRRHHQNGEQRDGGLARHCYFQPPAHQPAGKPAACDVAGASHQERDPGEFADLRHIEMAGRLQVFGKPEGVEIPNRIEENFREREAPHEARLEQLPGTRDRGLHFTNHLGRSLVIWPPEREPHKTKDADHDERVFPTKAQQDESDQRWGDNRTRRGTGIEDSGRHGSLILREPFGHDADGRGPVARLPRTK